MIKGVHTRLLGRDFILCQKYMTQLLICILSSYFRQKRNSRSLFMQIDARKQIAATI